MGLHCGMQHTNAAPQISKAASWPGATQRTKPKPSEYTDLIRQLYTCFYPHQTMFIHDSIQTSTLLMACIKRSVRIFHYIVHVRKCGKRPAFPSSTL